MDELVTMETEDSYQVSCVMCHFTRCQIHRSIGMVVDMCTRNYRYCVINETGGYAVY